MITATRRLQFCSGHRVFKHESKCKFPHGHNYVAYITAVGINFALDGIGRVIDFSALKEKYQAWIDANWDHGFIVWNEDKELVEKLATIEDLKLFGLQNNPTAENMALHLLRIGPTLLQGTGVAVVKVKLYETENCYVEVVA